MLGWINGESIAGISLAFLALLFVYAGSVNEMWAIALPAAYVLLAVGIALIGLGIWTAKNEGSKPSVEHSH